MPSMSSSSQDADCACSSRDQEGAAMEGLLEVKDSFRKAMPTLDAEEDVCSICLDEFSKDDPGIPTRCGHSYHLQCIMQWAQRSKECPLCYRDLGLKDPDLHAMLPFGEYVRPENNHAGVYMGMEAWEVDRILQRLALQNYSGNHRRSRTRSHNRQSESRATAAPASEARASSIAIPQPTRNDRGAVAAAEFPGSWPPRAYTSRERKSEPPSSSTLRSDVSGDVRPAGESLRSRWSSFQAKCRESLSGRSSSGVAK